MTSDILYHSNMYIYMYPLQDLIQIGHICSYGCYVVFRVSDDFRASFGDLSKVDLEDVAGPGAKVQAFEVPEIESVFVHKLDVHVFYSICHNCPQFMAAFIYVFCPPNQLFFVGGCKINVASLPIWLPERSFFLRS